MECLLTVNELPGTTFWVVCGMVLGWILVRLLPVIHKVIYDWAFNPDA